MFYSLNLFKNALRKSNYFIILFLSNSAFPARQDQIGAWGCEIRGDAQKHADANAAIPAKAGTTYRLFFMNPCLRAHGSERLFFSVPQPFRKRSESGRP